MGLYSVSECAWKCDTEKSGGGVRWNQLIGVT